MNRACQQANTTQQRFPWTCDTNEFGTKETVEKGLPASAEKQLNVRFFFCLFVCYRHKLSLYPARLFYVHNAGFHLHNACEMRAY